MFPAFPFFTSLIKWVWSQFVYIKIYVAEKKREKGTNQRLGDLTLKGQCGPDGGPDGQETHFQNMDSFPTVSSISTDSSNEVKM